MRRWATALGVAGLALLPCLSPALAAAWMARAARPALLALNRLSARLPFPLAEPLALLGAAWFAATLLRRRWRAAARAALALGVSFALLWLPALRATAPEPPPTPEAVRLERLCAQLVRDLNAAPPAPGDLPGTLRGAARASGLPEGAVKAVRYPEWMRARRIAGLFVPWTGEALVDATADPALIPFTAVHELAHLRGAADEGQANIVAWERCLRAGGAFAASARLWALRYAAGLLAEADTGRLTRALGAMDEPLARAWAASGGPLAPDSRGYHRLVLWLIHEESAP